MAAQRTAAAAPVARTAAAPLITAPAIASPPAATRTARPAARRAVRRAPARRPAAPPAHRIADFSPEGAASSGGGTALFFALVLAFLLAGPAGPGEPVAALRQRARAAMGRRLEHPG
jgi:hypothetical protein